MPAQAEETKRAEVPDGGAPLEGDSLPAEAFLRELTPRAVAPERTIDLSAMRELANFSATAAIETHARGRLIRASGGKLLVAVVAAVCAGVLCWHAVYLDRGPLTLYSAAASFIIALYWSFRYLILTGRIIAAGPDDASPGAPPTGHDLAPAVDPSAPRRPKAPPIAPRSERTEPEPPGR